MPELCILFHYHRVDNLTLQHLHLLKQHNPDAVIIPVTHDVHEQLPHSVDVKLFQSVWDTGNKWRSIDTTFYLWFINRQISAERYIIMEYDCRCTLPLREAYAAVWDAAVSCRSFYTLENKPNWGWFNPAELAKLAPDDRNYAAGVVPYACTLFSHAAAEQIVEHVTRQDVFCELRLGTAIRKAGLEVTPFPDTLRKTVFATPTHLDLEQPGIFHPVKSKAVHADQMQQKMRQKQREAQPKRPNNPSVLFQLKQSIKKALHP